MAARAWAGWSIISLALSLENVCDPLPPPESQTSPIRLSFNLSAGLAPAPAKESVFGETKHFFAKNAFRQALMQKSSVILLEEVRPPVDGVGSSFMLQFFLLASQFGKQFLSLFFDTPVSRKKGVWGVFSFFVRLCVPVLPLADAGALHPVHSVAGEPLRHSALVLRPVEVGRLAIDQDLHVVPLAALKKKEKKRHDAILGHLFSHKIKTRRLALFTKLN